MKSILIWVVATVLCLGYAKGQTAVGEWVRQLPTPPAAEQLMVYHEARLDGQEGRMKACEAAAYATLIDSLARQADSLAARTVDSTSAAGFGLDDLLTLSRMGGEELEGYLYKRFRPGHTDGEAMRLTVVAIECVTTLRPFLGRWDEARHEAQRREEAATEECRRLYRIYEPRLAQCDDLGRNFILRYFLADALPILRSSVTEAAAIRLERELPAAEEVDSRIEKLRTRHPDLLAPGLSLTGITVHSLLAGAASLTLPVEDSFSRTTNK
jgi:hypothetical protein